MIAALLWKEYREHRAVWLALAGLSAGVLLAVPPFFESDPAARRGVRESLGVVAVLLVWAYGMVCGAMLLAGEREGGTQTFLDTLPSARLPLWLGKCLAGGLFVALHLAALAGLAVWVVADSPGWAVPLLWWLAGGAAAGYTWGLFCSALTRGVLNAVALAILLQAAAGPVLYVFFLLPLALLLHLGLGGGASEAAFVAAPVLVILAPLPLSALVYSRTDRRRQGSMLRLPGGPDWMAGWRQAAWLSWRQTRGLVPWLAVFALAGGVGVAIAPLLLWPLFSLCLGLFCGVTAFLDEQDGPRRFLGEQRLPLGRVWLVKVGMRLTLTLLALAVMLLPIGAGYVYTLLSDLGTRSPEVLLEDVTGSVLLARVVPPGLFILTWPLYGFAAGHLCGLLFRKPLVALVVGLGVAVLLVGVWVPSLLAGGLLGWQVLLVPAVLLGCGRLLMRPWAADRIASAPALRWLAGAGLASAGLIGLGLWYRAAEVPDVGEPPEVAAFAESLQVAEKSPAGGLIRQGCTQLGGLLGKWDAPAAGGPRQPFSVRMAAVLERGWPGADAGMAAALDDAFAEPWWRPLAEAAGQPVGVVEDPRRMTATTHDRVLWPGHVAGELLAARGLQQQAMRDDPAAFVEHIRVGLALARNLESHSTTGAAHTGRAVEANLLLGLQRWLEALDGRPDLLRRVGTLLGEHRKAMPADNWEQRCAEYLVARNTLESPGDWARWLLHDRRSRTPQIEEAALLVAAWQLPWEHARQQRILRLVHWGPRPITTPSTANLGLLVPLNALHADGLPAGQPRRLARLEAVRLLVALRLYQAEHQGNAAASLAELVPKYLDAVPADPFDGRPFRYRLSKGEPITGPAGEARPVPAGQGVVWSVGEDGTDDGGRRQGLGAAHDRTQLGEDLIYLVPPPRRGGE